MKDVEVEGTVKFVFDLPIGNGIFSLCTVDNLIFCGCTGSIFVYKWTDEFSGFFDYCDTLSITSNFNMDIGPEVFFVTKCIYFL